MASTSGKRAGYVVVPGPGNIIDSLKVHATLLDEFTKITPNYFTRRDDIRLGGSHPTVLTDLSNPRKQQSQFFIRAESSSGVFAIKCLVSGKYDRRQRSLHDQKYHEAAALRKYTKIKDNTRTKIYAQAVKDENQPAWDDYEVQNYVCYILDGHPNIVNLCGFAQWTELEDVNKGLLLLYYENCSAGTLVDYARHCYDQRRTAVETFIIEHVALSLLSVVDWLQGTEFILLRPSVLHRNIRPENVHLHHVGGSHWPVVKLGGFEKLTPFVDDIGDIKSVGQRGPWDAPEFPVHFKASDIWSIGAVVHAALAYGHPPPADKIIGKEGSTVIDLEAVFENSPLQWYSEDTQFVLAEMLVTDPSQRLSAANMCGVISEVKDTIRAEENPVSWNKVREDPVHEPSEFIDEYMTWLESNVERYLTEVYVLACQHPCNLVAKDTALPEMRIFDEEACKVLSKWCSLAISKRKSGLQSKINNEGHLLAVNIYSYLRSAGNEFWYPTRAQYLAIPAPRRGRYLGADQNVPRTVRIRTQDFISYIQPLVEDVFWRITKDYPDGQLNAFPNKDLIKTDDFKDEAAEYIQLPDSEHSIAQDGIPSLEEIAEALQVWLLEKYHQGVLQYARTEQRLLKEAQIYAIRTNAEASLLVLPESWLSGKGDEPCTAWCETLVKYFDISWDLSVQYLQGRKQPLQASDLAGLYRIAEEFASNIVPVSTNCLRVMQSRQEEVQTRYLGLLIFLHWVQRRWDKKWRLYPEMDGPPVIALKDNLPSATPSFGSIKSDLAIIDELKLRLQKQIEETRKLWSNIFRENVKFYHASSKEKREQNPAHYTDRAKDATARKLAGKINLASGNTGSLDPALRQNIIYLAAHGAILQELQTTSTSGHEHRKENVENAILEALWPIEYAAAVCAVLRRVFRELIASSLVKSGQQFRRMKDNPSHDKIQTQIANFENKVTQPLAVLYKGLGFSEDSSQVETAAERLAETIKDPMMEWTSKGKNTTVSSLTAAADTFAKACDRLFDREWAQFRENYAKHIVNEVNPSSTPKRGSATVSDQGSTHDPGTQKPPEEEIVIDSVETDDLPTDAPGRPVVETFGSNIPRNISKGPMISRRRKGNYPEPRTAMQILSDEDTDWGYSDLGRDASWPSSPSSSSSSSPSPPPKPKTPPPPPPPKGGGSRGTRSTSIKDEEDDTQPKGEPPTGGRSKPPSGHQPQPTAIPPPAAISDILQQQVDASKDPLELESEAISAHSNIHWPLGSIEQKRRLLHAEAKRSKAYHLIGKPFAWQAARFYNAIPNPSDLPLTITTDGGDLVADRKVWHSQVRPRPAYSFPYSSPPPPLPGIKREQQETPASKKGQSPNRPGKRRLFIGSEPVAKKPKLWENVPKGPTPWNNIGKALIEVVPGVKSIASFFTGSPPKAIKQEDPQSGGIRSLPKGSEIPSSATTFLIETGAPAGIPHPNNHESRLINPTDRKSRGPHQPHVSVNRKFVLQIPRGLLELMLKGDPDSKILNLRIGAKADAVPPRGDLPAGALPQPQHYQRLRSPIQFVGPQQGLIATSIDPAEEGAQREPGDHGYPSGEWFSICSDKSSTAYNRRLPARLRRFPARIIQFPADGGIRDNRDNAVQRPRLYFETNLVWDENGDTIAPVPIPPDEHERARRIKLWQLFYNKDNAVQKAPAGPDEHEMARRMKLLEEGVLPDDGDEANRIMRRFPAKGVLCYDGDNATREVSLWYYGGSRARVRVSDSDEVSYDEEEPEYDERWDHIEELVWIPFEGFQSGALPEKDSTKKSIKQEEVGSSDLPKKDSTEKSIKQEEVDDDRKSRKSRQRRPGHGAINGFTGGRKIDQMNARRKARQMMKIPSVL